jgi:pimeloyl-ACP methyl ester carboxylesterase
MKKGLKFTAFVILVIFLLLATVPLLIPLPPLENILPIEKLVDSDSKFIRLNNLNVHYKEAGAGGQALILLHGFGASTYSWREVLQPLSKNGLVVAYDRPAFGLTERPMQWEGESPYGLQAQVKLVIAMLDAKGIDKAVLIGNSAGGTVAIKTALMYPERVKALVLVDAAVYSGGALPQWLKPILQTPQATKIGQLIARQIQDSGMKMLVSAWYDPSKITAEITSNYRKPLQIDHWDRALWDLTVTQEPSGLVEHLGQLNVPVLVVSGDSDHIVPLEQSIRLSKEIPGAQLTVFSQCGHVPQEECPDQFLQAVDNFLVKIKGS